MIINMKAIIISWVTICLLIPAEFRLGGIYVLDLSMISIIGLSFLSWLQSGSQVKLLSKVEKSLILFLCAALISYIFNGFSSFEEQKNFVASIGLSTDFLFARLTAYGIMTLLMIIGGYRIVATYIVSRADIETVIRTIIGLGTLNAVITIGYWLMVTGGKFDRYNYVPPLEGSQGIHLHYMSLVFLLSFAVMISGTQTSKQKIFLFIAMIATGLSTLTVLVRQGWILFIISLIITVGLLWKKLSSKGRNIAALLAAVLMLVCIYFIAFKFKDLFLEILIGTDIENRQGSGLMRLTLIMHGFELFKAHPIWGIGFGHYPAYSDVPIFGTGIETFVASPHNGIVTIAAEAGITGIISLFFICYYLLRECRLAHAQCTNAYLNSVVASVYSVLIINVAAQFVSNSLIIPLPTERSMMQSSLILWILFGIVTAIRMNQCQEQLDAEQ